MVILLHNEADFSHEMSLNACKAQHIIHDFICFLKPDSSPISSHIKHIILSLPPDRIPWKTRLVQQLTCISKYFKKSCIVFSNIYRSMAWSKSTSLPLFYALVSRNEQQCFFLCRHQSDSTCISDEIQHLECEHMWPCDSKKKSSQQGQSSPSDMFCLNQREREIKKTKERKRWRARESKLQRLQVFHIT